MMNNSVEFLIISLGRKGETPTYQGGAMERITWKVPIGWLQGDLYFPFGAFLLCPY